MADEKIRAMFVFEIMGRPATHIKETLDMFIDKLAEIPVITIEDRVVHEPKKIEKENVQDFYSSFAEVELTSENFDTIIEIVLNMLPAHVEILEPSELRMKNFELSSMLSKLAIRIHKFDEIAKASIMERNILMKRLEEMQEKINGLEKGKKPKKKASSKSKVAAPKGVPSAKGKKKAKKK